jgi:ankyrin repeat protein
MRGGKKSTLEPLSEDSASGAARSKSTDGTCTRSTSSSDKAKARSTLRRANSAVLPSSSKKAEKENAKICRSSSSSIKKKTDDSSSKKDKSSSKSSKRRKSVDSNDAASIKELQKLIVNKPKEARAMMENHPSLAQAKDKNGLLPLHLAAQHNAPADVLEKIIELYPDACDVQCGAKGFTPLHFAVEANLPTPKVKALIKASPRALKAADKKGQIPLHIAVGHNARVASIRLLVFIFPESVDLENAKGETARKIAKRKKLSADVINELKGKQ